MDLNSGTSQLSLEEYRRYGRQMILDGIGLPGTTPCTQLIRSNLCTRAARVTQCIGRGRRCWRSRVPGTSIPRGCRHRYECPFPTLWVHIDYYVLGKLGIVDHDVVEVSNLQRQILHSEKKIGMNKALSAAETLS